MRKARREVRDGLSEVQNRCRTRASLEKGEVEAPSSTLEGKQSGVMKQSI